MEALIRKSNGLNKVSFSAKIKTKESSKLKTSNVLTSAIQNAPQAAASKYFDYEKLRLGMLFYIDDIAAQFNEMLSCNSL